MVLWRGISHDVHLERHLGVHLLVLMVAAPRSREPKDAEQDHHGRDLESRLALLSHHRFVRVHDMVLRAGRREEGRFGVHLGI
jgi:hypothetical protein